MKKYILIFFLSFFPVSAFCQEKRISNEIIEIAEELAIDESDPEAVGMYVEQLHELAENPVDVNSGDESEISRLFFLTDFQVKAIADYVMNSGKIVSVYEIAILPGFDRRNTEMIIPFIALSSKNINSSDTPHLRNTFLSNLILKPGVSDTSFIGSSIKSLVKIKCSSGRFTATFTNEKDAGEKLSDFFSGSLAYDGKGILRKLIAGDFSARFGQGLNVNTGLRTGLLLTSQGYISSRNEIRQYTSTDENSFFRGLAAQLEYKKTEIALYFSRNNIDGTLNSSGDSSISFIESFYEAGIHNTPSLASKKDAITVTSYGINVLISFRNLKTGLCYTENRFSEPIIPDITDPVNLFRFKGIRNRTFSAHYNAVINKFLISGELAANNPESYAFVQGVTVRPSDRLSINILYRDYSPQFSSFYGNGPGNSPNTSNEKGILGNFSFEAAKHLFISAGCDLSNSPWLKYQISYPSRSLRSELRINYNPSEYLDMGLTYNIREKLIDRDDNSGIPGIEESKSHWIKGVVKYRFNERISLTTRIDYKVFESTRSTGMLFLQDISFTFRKIPLTLWARHCLFNTNGWDSRIYTYENDLFQSFSIPALYGTGTRSYIMLKWDIGKRAEMRARYSVTSRESEYEVYGNNDLKFQVRLWF